MTKKATYEELQKRLKKLEKEALRLMELKEEMEKGEREKETLLNSMLELVTYQDMEMKIVWANKAVAKSLGVPSEQLMGRYCYEI